MEDQFLDSNLNEPTSKYKDSDFAGFWQRFGAAFVDGMLLFIVGQLVLGAFGISFMELMQGAARGEDPKDLFGSKYLIASMVSLAINWYYYAQQESSEAQATLGKRAVGLIVTDLKGNRVSFQQASVRFLMKQIISIISLLSVALALPESVNSLSLLALVGYLIQPFTPKKQAFHDIVAKTLVYKK